MAAMPEPHMEHPQDVRGIVVQRSPWQRLGGVGGMRPILVAILGVGIAAYLVLRTQGDDLPLSVVAPIAGHPAPDSTLRDIGGEQRTLHLQHGRAVLLNFWGIYCPPCRREMPEIQRAVRYFQGQPVSLWGIDVQGDATPSIRRFINQIGVSYPQLPDPGLTVGHRYHINGLPVSVFIGTDGRVRLVHLGALTYPDFVMHLKQALRAP